MPQERVDTVVHGGQIVTSTDVYEASVAVKDGLIATVGPQDLLPPAERYIDASGKYVLPGAIDCHLHIDPAKCDDWGHAPTVAAHSGITTIVVFAMYDGQDGETLPKAIDRNREEAEAGSVVDFGFHFILHNQPYILEGVPQAFQMGVTSYKMFMTYKATPNRMCSDDFICSAMEIIAKHGGITQLHCENGDILHYLEHKFIAEGKVEPRYYPPSCPTWAEEEAINRAVKMGDMTNCPTYVVHLSTKLGLERIKQAQRTGQWVWTETCPQYLLLSDAEMDRWGPHAKIGPPLRPEGGGDQEALWDGMKGGFISVVASDHAAQLKEKKEDGWLNIFRTPGGKAVPFGSSAVETMVPLMYSEGVVKRGFPLTWMARALAENPARVFGLYPRKGVIRAGADADLLIMDPEPESTIAASDLHSRAGVTMYEGWKLKGQPWMTLLRGEVVLNQGRIEQKLGYGQYLHRGGPMPPIGGYLG